MSDELFCKRTVELQAAADAARAAFNEKNSYRNYETLMASSLALHLHVKSPL